LSFTPIFSGISSLWLAALAGHEKGEKEQRDFEKEQSCLSVMQIFAHFGAALDSEVKIHLSNDARHQFTLLHAAAAYSCLYGGRAFKQRQSFLLDVAQILANNMAPSERTLFFWKMCKVEG
jgi:hypothetical protein